jgi:transposase
LDRFMLTDAQWAKLAPLLPGKRGDPGRPGKDNRLFVESVLWIARTGAPWRDIPATFGDWNAIYKRFRRWVVKGIFERIFTLLREAPDCEYVIADGSIIRVHQKATGARGGTHNQAIGRSRGGLTSKIVALVDGLGNLVKFILMPGQRHDSRGVAPLIEGLTFGAFVGDKAFDNDELRQALNERGAKAVIPPRRNRTTLIEYDREMYKWRHLIENCFAKLKEFRRIATRYDKTDRSFAAMIYVAATIFVLR